MSRIDQVSDPPAPDAAGAAPLYVGNRLFYPNLGAPIRRSATSELPFFFTLYGTDSVHPEEAFVQLPHSTLPGWTMWPADRLRASADAVPDC